MLEGFFSIIVSKYILAKSPRVVISKVARFDDRDYRRTYQNHRQQSKKHKYTCQYSRDSRRLKKKMTRWRQRGLNGGVSFS